MNKTPENIIVVKDAIERSVSHNEIVHLSPDTGDIEAICLALLVECDDNVEANGVAEYWGEDEDGEPWRVHVDSDTAEA